MSDLTQLEALLRDHRSGKYLSTQTAQDAAEAIKGLREALGLFAEHADAWHDDEPDTAELIEGFDSVDHGFFVPPVTVGDLRAARAALTKAPTSHQEDS